MPTAFPIRNSQSASPTQRRPTPRTCEEAPSASDGAGEPWAPARLKAAREAHRALHPAGIRLDPEARNVRHTHVTPAPPDAPGTWRVEQMLIDAEGDNDWVAQFAVDLIASRATGEPVLQLARLAPL